VEGISGMLNRVYQYRAPNKQGGEKMQVENWYLVVCGRVSYPFRF
jgi:hypothetical protein